MRILLINSEYPPIGGGAGNASANLARTLVKLEHEVTVLTARFDELPKEERCEGVRIVRAPAVRRQRDRSGAWEQASFVLGGSLWGVRLARRWRPDAVLAFFGVPGGAVALILRWFFGLRYVVSLRGGDVPGFRPYDFALYHRVIAPLLHVIWRRAAAVVANSQGLREMAGAFEPKVQTHVIPNGVDAARFAVEGRQWEPPHLLLVGRVVYQKGIDLLLAALAGLTDLEWRLTIAGDGPSRNTLEDQAERLGIGARVHFAGWQENDELLTCYRRANLFVYPSRHEGMPNAVLEAMASGLPVVATRIAGNEELVVPGKTGLLVPPEDVDALREALAALIPDVERRAAMGKAGRKRVETAYGWERVAEGYLRLMIKNTFDSL